MPRTATSEQLPVWQIPPLDPERKLFTGTAAGLAREIGVDPVYVRATFVVLGVAGGWGIALYAVAWVILSRRSNNDAPYEPRPKGANGSTRLAGTGMIALGLVLMTTVTSAFSPGIVWPVALLSGALAIALDRGQLDTRQLSDLGHDDNLQIRVVVGLALFLAGVIAALALSLSFWQAVRSIIVAGLVLAGAALVFAPVLARLANDLFAERRMRIRSEERADMAAHLHDSVLQTLALIQKRSDDVSVVNLARRQERELRTWLFEEKSLHESLGFRIELEHAMAEVEDLHEVPIEVIVVGDRPSGPETEAILNAAKEAATNAARHSGAPRIDVFAEVAAESVEVFVRDQGCGFDLDAVESDRAGIRDSIVRRMQRHKGTAEVISIPGVGTEVELSLPTGAAAPAPEVSDV